MENFEDIEKYIVKCLLCGEPGGPFLYVGKSYYYAERKGKHYVVLSKRKRYRIYTEDGIHFEAKNGAKFRLFVKLTEEYVRSVLNNI